MTKQQQASNLRQLGALVAIIVSSIPQVPMQSGLERVIYIAGGILLFVVEHFVGDTSTGTPAPPK